MSNYCKWGSCCPRNNGVVLKNCNKPHPFPGSPEWDYFPYPCDHKAGINCDDSGCYDRDGTHNRPWNTPGTCQYGLECDNLKCEMHLDNKGRKVEDPQDCEYDTELDDKNHQPPYVSNTHSVLLQNGQERKIHKSLSLTKEFGKQYPDLDVKMGYCDVCSSSEHQLLILVRCGKNKTKSKCLCQFCYFKRRKCGWCDGEIDLPIYKCLNCKALYQDGIIRGEIHQRNPYVHNGCSCLEEICPYCSMKHKNHRECVEIEEKKISEVINNLKLD